YRPGDVVDAPVAVAVDAPPDSNAAPDAFSPDVPCTDGDRRCNSDGNLAICAGGLYVAAFPSCATMAETCFDPSPAGGTDAYCGACLKGASRCTADTPPAVETCDGNGQWGAPTPCTAGFGCVDPDGDTGPMA